jgi:hypothetical protein
MESGTALIASVAPDATMHAMRTKDDCEMRSTNPTMNPYTVCTTATAYMTLSYFATISIVSLANSTLVDNRSCVTAARESDNVLPQHLGGVQYNARRQYAMEGRLQPKRAERCLPVQARRGSHEDLLWTSHVQIRNLRVWRQGRYQYCDDGGHTHGDMKHQSNVQNTNN